MPVREGNRDFIRRVAVHFRERKQTVGERDLAAVSQSRFALLIGNFQRRHYAVDRDDRLFDVRRQILCSIVGNVYLERIVFEFVSDGCQSRLIQHDSGTLQDVVFLLIQKDFNIVVGADGCVE